MAVYHAWFCRIPKQFLLISSYNLVILISPKWVLLASSTLLSKCVLGKFTWNHFIIQGMNLVKKFESSPHKLRYLSKS